LRLTDIHESDDTLQAAASAAERTTPTVLPEAESDDDNDLDDDLRDQRDEDSLINNDIGDLRLQITDEDPLHPVTRNRLMLEMLLENQARWTAELRPKWARMAVEWEIMTAERDQWAAECAAGAERSIAGPRPNIYKMVEPVRYWGGAIELDWFLDALHLNWNFYRHLFRRGGSNRVKYPISFLDAWCNHSNLALRQTAITDPWEWAGDLSAKSGPCLQDFDHFSKEIAKVYRDRDQCRVAVITLMQEYILLPPDSVRAYANCVKANRRQARWNLH